MTNPLSNSENNVVQFTGNQNGKSFDQVPPKDTSRKRIFGRSYISKSDNGIINPSAHEIKETWKQISVGGGGGGMDDLRKRIESLEKSMVELKGDLKSLPNSTTLELHVEKLKTHITDSISKLPDANSIKVIITEQLKASNIPDEDKVKNIISDQIIINKIANIGDVEKAVVKSQNRIVWWILASVVSLTLVAFRSNIIKLFS